MLANLPRPTLRTIRTHLAAVVAAMLLAPSAMALSDSQLLSAREAYRKNDLPTLTTLANQAEDGLLDPWAQYWHALRQLEAGDSQPARTLVNRLRSGYLVERTLNEWLQQMGSQAQWDAVLQLAPSLSPTARDQETACYIDLATLRQLQNLKTALDPLATNLPDGCAQLLDAQAARGLLPAAQVRARLRVLLQGNFTTAAKRLATAANLEDSFLSAGSAEQQAQTLVKLARNDWAAALIQLQAAENRLDREQAGYVYGQLALLAARRLDVTAAQAAYAKADTAQLNTEQWEWWLRATLRTEDWAKLEQLTRRLPAELAEKTAWQYWRARALLGLGRGSEAAPLLIKASFEHNYYGLLSRDELGTTLDVPPEKVQISPAIQQQLANDLAVRQALAFVELAERSGRTEWRDEGRRVWRWVIRDRSDEQLLAAADLARSKGYYDMAIQAAERTRSSHDFGLRYLAPYRDITKPYANQLDIDEAWVYGLIRQESRFYNVARSGVGASGLMQLMPATAKMVANRLGLGSYQINDIDTNIKLGTWYLRHVLDDLQSHPVLATAAYNAGPGRARRWQESRPMEGAIYAETIPFSETRDYVQKVMANAVYYAGAFRQPGASLKQRLGTIPPR